MGRASVFVGSQSEKMRAPTASNKRNSSSVTAGQQQLQQQPPRKSAKGQAASVSRKQHHQQTSVCGRTRGESAEQAAAAEVARHQMEDARGGGDSSESAVQAAAILGLPLDSVAHVSGSQDDHRKQNHCEIEKRRRDRMNHYIMALASVIPSFNNNQSKLDKLTVLRMAVQHVKSLRSSLCSFSSFHLRPSFLSSGNLLKNLILQMASQESQDNLFMVVSCDRGKVLFVSQSSKDILNQDQHELVGQCLFDILHKDDVSKVKEQISYFNLMPKEMLVDSKTLQPIKHHQRQSFSQLQNQFSSTPQPGARRSFFCRMKSGRGGAAGKCSSSTVSSSSQSMNQRRNDPQTSIGARFCSTGAQQREDGSIGKNGGRGNCDSSAEAPSHLQPRNTPSLNSQSNHNISSTHFSDSDRSAAIDRTKSSTNNPNPGDNIGGRDKDCERVNSSNSSDSNDNNNSAGTNNNGGESKLTANPGNNRGGKNSLGVIINNSSSSNISSADVESGSGGDGSNSSSSGTASDGPSNERSSCRNDCPTVDKTGCGVKRNSSGTKTSHGSGSDNGSGSKKHWRYTVMHCTGYLKALTLRNDELDDDDFDDLNSESNSSDDEENDSSSKTINCLVAVCRRSPMDRDLKPDRPLTFTCRYSMEGKFVFVDQRTTVALGYTPQQLLGTSHYAYCHKDSVNTFKECHRQSILKSEPVSSDIYQFKRANGQHLWLQTSLKSFRNPWTKFIDYIVANHTTAEGSDPHYNEGCVPTKFNQDMTGGGEASQSSSPASSSSLSLPSMDSKKSSSPSSSSMGSSYSMDSYASGGSIQALLNQIDRVKSGGIKHTLDIHRKRGDNYVIRSGGGSARKSNEDSGNYSDPQSCSSFSSQNSALSTEYMNIPGMNNFVDTNSQVNATSLNNPNNPTNNTYENQRLNGFRVAQNLCNPSNYQPTGQPMETSNSNVNNPPAFESTNSTPPIRATKTGVRMGGKVVRPQGGPAQHHQRHSGKQYHYKGHHSKSSSSTSSDTGNESAPWSHSSGSVYSNGSSHHGRRGVEQVTAVRPQVGSNLIKDSRSTGICGDVSCQTIERRQPSYVMQPVEDTSMNIVSGTVEIQNQMSVIGNQMNESYSNELMPVGSYMSQEDVNSSYNSGVSMSQMQQMTNDLQPNMNMTLQEHQTQLQRSQQSASSDHINIPMMWNTTETQYQNLGPMQNTGTEQQICPTGDETLMNMDVGNSNNQMIAQPVVHCQQCANHKCSSQQMVMTNNTDLNSINLTSLAVDGDLDEDQLLEYLAGCDPEAQLYHIQNNAFPQYNIYQ